MTDRHAGYLVTLAHDTREDDAEQIVNAIMMIKGVAACTPIVSDSSLELAQLRAKHNLRNKILNLLLE